MVTFSDLNGNYFWTKAGYNPATAIIDKNTLPSEMIQVGTLQYRGFTMPGTNTLVYGDNFKSNGGAYDGLITYRFFGTTSNVAGSKFTNETKASVREAMNDVESFANIKFQEVAANVTKSDYYIKETTSGLGAGYVGSGNALNPTANYQKFSAEYSVLLQEFGHGLGLDGDNMGFNDPGKNVELTVMDNSRFFGMDGFGLYDVATLQAAYGVNRNYMAGNTTYTISETEITITDNGVQKEKEIIPNMVDFIYNSSNSKAPTGETAIGDMNAISSSRYKKVIWDGGGNDTLEFQSKAGKSTVIDIREGAENASKMSQSFTDYAIKAWKIIDGKNVYEDAKFADAPMKIWAAFGANIENATGGAGNDAMYGNTMNNVLTGKDGTDTLVGNKGNDTLIGGAHKDTYIFAAGDGQDVVRDSGDNVLNISGKVLSGAASLVSGSTYKLSVGGTDYSLTKVATGLKVTTGSDSVLLENFQSGDFGITLPSTNPTTPTTPPAPVVPTPKGNELLFSDANSKYAVGAVQSGVNPQNIDVSKILAATNKISGTLDGTAQNFLFNLDSATNSITTDIRLGAGNDYAGFTFTKSVSHDVRVFGEEGNDTLLYLSTSGKGSAVLNGGYGNDILLGAGAASYLYGSPGDDTLYSGSTYSQLTGGEGKDSIYLLNANSQDNIYFGVGASTKASSDIVYSFNSSQDLLQLTELGVQHFVAEEQGKNTIIHNADNSFYLTLVGGDMNNLQHAVVMASGSSLDII